MAKLTRDGYAAQVLTRSRPKVLIITGRILSGPELLAIGSPSPATPWAQQEPAWPALVAVKQRPR